MKKFFVQLKKVFRPSFSNRLLQNTLCALLLSGGVITSSPAAAHQQQTSYVSLQKGSITLKEVISQVERQTDYLFVYNKTEVDVNRRIDIPDNRMSVSDIIRLLEQAQVGASLSENYISLSEMVTAAATDNVYKISGNIRDSKGEPVIGANVILKETPTIGTNSDIDGNFTLQVRKGDVVQVSYIGYADYEVTVTNQTFLTIELQDMAQAMDEVVVVAFGVQKKSSLTSSISTLSADKFANRPVTNTSQALQGMLPGLNMTMNRDSGGNINSSLGVNIRGKGTIGKDSNDSPLVLIDGVAGDMNMVNPQDIDNISVLKDASAASIYGSRAAFGVVLITTKKGNSGKCSVNYSNNLQISTPQILPTQMDSYTYVNYINQANRNDGASAFFPDEQVERVKLYQQGTLLKEGATEFDPMWTVNPMSNAQYRVRDYWGNTDWLDMLFKDKAFSHEHNLSISGGSDKIRYYVSGNYMTKSGMANFVNDNLDRYTFTSRLNVDCTKWLKMQTITRFARTDFDTASAASGTYKMWTYIPTVPLYDPNGHYVNYENLIPIIEGGRYKSQKDVLTNSLQFVFLPVKGLRITADGTYRVNTAFNHNDVLKVMAYDANNKPYYVKNSGHAPGTSEVKEHADKANFFSTSVVAEYNKLFNDAHDFNIMVGFQYEHNKGRDLEALQDGIITSDVPTLDTTNGVNDKVSGGYSHWGTAGLFGRLNYAYKNRYLLEFKLRYDGSSRFLEDQRWNLFPSISVGWNIANEKFMEGSHRYLSALKLRASYGTLGNQNTTNLYPFYPSLPLGSANGGWLVAGERPNTAGLPGLVSSALGWEKIHDFNVGLDFGWFDNRLTGSFDYFHRYTYDMVGPGIEMPNTLGTPVPIVNNADLVTRGFELELSWRDRLKCGFGYGIRFVLSDSQTEVLKYPNDQMKTDTFYKGKKLGEIWGYDVIGIARTQEEMDNHLANVKQNFNGGTKWQAGDLMYADNNDDGEINGGKGLLGNMGDKRVIGNDTPRYNFGLTLDMEYKGWSVSAFFNGTMKRDYWAGGRAFWGANGSIWSSTAYTQCLDYFRPEGTNDPLGPNTDGYLPGLSFSGKNKQISTAYLQSAAYIKLKNLQFGYSFPKKIANKIGLQNLRLFVSMENLWTGTSLFKTIDPEMLNDSGNFYPLARTYSFGVNVTF